MGINGNDSGSNRWWYVNVPYFWPYFVPEMATEVASSPCRSTTAGGSAPAAMDFHWSITVRPKIQPSKCASQSLRTFFRPKIDPKIDPKIIRISSAPNHPCSRNGPNGLLHIQPLCSSSRARNLLEDDLYADGSMAHSVVNPRKHIEVMALIEKKSIYFIC
jgi:hypothetical protein